jgi:hypothetical protein
MTLQKSPKSGGMSLQTGTLVSIVPVEGTADFCARFGYKAQRPTGPAMYRWLNRSAE